MWVSRLGDYTSNKLHFLYGCYPGIWPLLPPGFLKRTSTSRPFFYSVTVPLVTNYPILNIVCFGKVWIILSKKNSPTICINPICFYPFIVEAIRLSTPPSGHNFYYPSFVFSSAGAQAASDLCSALNCFDGFVLKHIRNTTAIFPYILRSSCAVYGRFHMKWARRIISTSVADLFHCFHLSAIDQKATATRHKIT